MENLRESHMQQRVGRRVVLFPSPLQGHITPMLQLGNILYSKGISITIIHFNSPITAKYPHFTFHLIPIDLMEHEAATADVIDLFLLLNVNCIEPFKDCLVSLLANVEEEPITCVITDAVWYFTQPVAESLKLPRIVLRTSSVCSFLAFAAFPLLHEKGILPIQDSQFELSIPELQPLKVKDLPVIETRNPDALNQLISGMVSQTKASSGIIWNSFEELEQTALTKFRQDFPIPAFPIGPFHKYFLASSSSLLSADQSSISWLDKQAPKSVIYVSFGSLAAVNEAEFLEIAWGLANCNQPFLWVVRPGSIRGSEWIELLPNGFLEILGGRGHIVKWAPQQEVLAHPATGGFWTHNGWNSTLESICEGVPMICQPSFGDQRVNARYVDKVWRVGVHLENKMERGEIERAIRKVFVEAEGLELRERTMVLKEKADNSLKQGVSSSQALDSLIRCISSF
ncbi:UDPGT domain-containing protein [Cephalotus follicularis]|uniref:UDPGT domain-containing protein n=1 Tax=Cephalotus follicularis TaxID=3775 RepID=A0A1Q3AM48_CEPFO|nr:UDPGT domain-containing protein [Cephalotus follicularis]